MALELTAQGLTIETLDEILTNLATQQKADIDTDLDTSAESELGKLNGVFASTLREVQEVLAAVHAARDPNNATFAALDGVSSITGTQREPATKGTVTLSVNLNAGVTLPAGSVAQVSGQPTNRWVTKVAVINTGGSPATVPVEAEAENTGVINAGSGTITVIATPVAGWNSVTNSDPATPGTEIELDSDLRVRREEELQSAGTSPLDAIRIDLLDVTYGTESVNEVRMYQNLSDTTDADGLKPHSVEAIVDATDHASPVAGMNTAIATQLFKSKAGGIETNGNITVNVIDSQGQTQPTKFRRPTDKNVYVSLTIVTDPNTYDSSGSHAALKSAIVLEGQSLFGIGDEVDRFQLLCAALHFTGVKKITAFTLGFTAAPTGTADLAIGKRERARFATSRIVVTAT